MPVIPHPSTPEAIVASSRTLTETFLVKSSRRPKIKAGIPADLLKQIANRLQTKSNYNGYEGNITAFLEPAANKGDIAEIDGFKYPEKSGSFFIEAVSGEFGTAGGRQTIELGFITQ